MELEFLDIIDFNLSINSEEYDIFYNELQTYFEVEHEKIIEDAIRHIDANITSIDDRDLKCYMLLTVPPQPAPETLH